MFKTLYRILLQFGFDGKKFISGISQISSIGWYTRNYRELKKQKGKSSDFEITKLFPILTDKYDEGGTMTGHYFHQDLFVARQVFLKSPRKHLDIGSRTDGFVAHVASFRDIEIVDIRDIKSEVKNIEFRQMNLMELPPHLINYCDSISSLHAIEHFGLGRYGDPVDYFGHIKAIENISKVLIAGGVFYFSVPIGPQRIEFNAHRVFSVRYLIDLLSNAFTIQSFSYVNDYGDFFEDVLLTNELIDLNFNCKYGCGIFVLQKK